MTRYNSERRKWFRLLSLLWLASIALIVLASQAQSSPFITEVLSYNPGPSQYEMIVDPDQRQYYMDLYMTPAKAIGAPVGAPVNMGNITSVVTLGDGGKITLAFDHDVENDPDNPGGYDFIVFSNAFWIGSNPQLRWQEPAFVEISQDNITWYLIKPNPLPSQLLSLDAVGMSSTILQNYAEYTPTLQKPANRTNEEFYTVPDRQSDDSIEDPTLRLDLLKIDAVSGGGDAFDIADAVVESSPGVPELDIGGNTIPAGISSFRFIRVTDAVAEGTSDPELGEISAEIDAVADVAPAISVGAAKQLDSTTQTVIWGAQVTATFSEEAFWIQQPDRSAGLKIQSTAAVAEGDLVAVTGHITEQNGEKVISDAFVTVLEHGTAPKPLGMINKSTGLTIAQGLLVRVWGKRIASGTGWVTVDDGSGLPVIVEYGSITTLPENVTFVMATGVLTQDTSGTSPVVKIRKPADINY